MYQVIFGDQLRNFNTIHQAVMFANSHIKLQRPMTILNLNESSDSEYYMMFLYDPETMELEGLVELKDLIVGHMELLNGIWKYLLGELNALPMDYRVPIDISSLKAFNIYPTQLILNCLESFFGYGFLSERFDVFNPYGNRIGSFPSMEAVPHVIFDPEISKTVPVLKAENLYRFFIMPYDMIIPDKMGTLKMFNYEEDTIEDDNLENGEPAFDLEISEYDWVEQLSGELLDGLTEKDIVIKEDFQLEDSDEDNEIEKED